MPARGGARCPLCRPRRSCASSRWTPPPARSSGASTRTRRARRPRAHAHPRAHVLGARGGAADLLRRAPLAATRWTRAPGSPSPASARAAASTCARASAGATRGRSASASTRPASSSATSSSWARSCPRACPPRPATSARSTSTPAASDGPSTRSRIPASRATTPGQRTPGATPAARTPGQGSPSTRGAASSSRRRDRPPTTSTARTAHGDNLFANTILCLRAATGERVWHFQAVKHDVWDRDFPAAPTLVTDHEGRPRASTSSRRSARTVGPTCSTARRDGRVFPMEEVAAPASDVPGESVAREAGPARAPPPFTRPALHRGPHHEAHARRGAGGAREVAEPAQGGRVRPAQHAGHDPVPGHGRRRGMGRRRLGPGDGPPVRQRERDGLDGAAEGAPDARRQAQTRARRCTQRHCASCHRADLRGHAAGDSVARRTSRARRSVDEVAAVVRDGGGRMPGAQPDPRRGAPRDRGVRGERPLGRRAAGRAHAVRRAATRSTATVRFTDPDGFPAITPALGDAHRDRPEPRGASPGRCHSARCPGSGSPTPAARTTAGRW